MNLDRSLFSSFKPIKHHDETIYWAGKPHFPSFIGQGILVLSSGIMWFVLLFELFFRYVPSGSSVRYLFLFIFVLIPLSCLFNLVKLLLEYRRTVYAITDR